MLVSLSKNWPTDEVILSNRYIITKLKATAEKPQLFFLTLGEVQQQRIIVPCKMSRNLSLTNIRGAVFFLLGRATVTNDPIRVPDMVIGPMCEICLVATLASTEKKM